MFTSDAFVMFKIDIFIDYSFDLIFKSVYIFEGY